MYGKMKCFASSREIDTYNNRQAFKLTVTYQIDIMIF
jgi:hypothetical protein